MPRTDDLGGDAPDWCFEAGPAGELPTCTFDGTEWHRSYDGVGLDGAGAGDGFESLMVLLLLLGVALAVGTAIWRTSTARRLARDSGLDEDEAARMALLTDSGLETTYLAAALRSRDETPGASTESEDPDDTTDVAARLRRLDRLREEELVSAEEWAERRRAILDEL